MQAGEVQAGAAAVRVWNSSSRAAFHFHICDKDIFEENLAMEFRDCLPKGL